MGTLRVLIDVFSIKWLHNTNWIGVIGLIGLKSMFYCLVFCSQMDCNEWYCSKAEKILIDGINNGSVVM